MTVYRISLVVGISNILRRSMLIFSGALAQLVLYLQPDKLPKGMLGLLNVLPCVLGSRAADKQETAAKKMRETAITKMGGQEENVFFFGEVVQVPVADVDKAKVDNHTLSGVIVQINYARLAVRVVVKAGLLQSWYQYHRLSRVTGPGNNIKLLGLEAAYLGWKTMKVVSEREASRNESVVGGQGKGTVICTCKGKCDSKICKCFKAGRICSSACHRNNKNCTNHDHNNKDKE